MKCSEIENSNNSTFSFLKSHYSEKVLPIWQREGFNADLQLAFEAISGDSRAPLSQSRYRAMACARQLYIFSKANMRSHADVLFDSIQRYFVDKIHGGWYFSVDENGVPKDRRKDLYTHAFIVYAMAEYARNSGLGAAVDIMNQTAELIEKKFPVSDDLSGLLNSMLSEDFSVVIDGPLQNPMMHLTEAWLSARNITNDSAYDARLAAVASAIAHEFVHEPTGCIAEFPLKSPSNRFEPGHQFEWYFLIFGSEHSAFDVRGLRSSITRAFSFAHQYGVDPVTNGVCAALDDTGIVIDSTQRIWAQTEYLRALAIHSDPGFRHKLERGAAHFRDRFLHESGWFECIAPDDTVTRFDMPSTTPYHLINAYSALP